MPPPRLLCYTNLMFLQTLVQLNILILATPALAGWTLMPLAHPGAVRAACVVWQFRAAEAAAPKANQIRTVQARRTTHPQPMVLPRLGTPSILLPTDQVAAFVAVPVAALVSFNPFPHATRAP